MAKTAEDILRDVLELPADERDRFLEKLTDLFAGRQPDEGYEEAWAAEIKRRADEVFSGRAVGRPWREILDELEAELVEGRAKPRIA